MPLTAFVVDRWEAWNINSNGGSVIAIKGSCKTLINGVKGKLFPSTQSTQEPTSALLTFLLACSPLCRHQLLQLVNALQSVASRLFWVITLRFI